jgi:uncharacterized protein (DUF849 family)
MPKDNRVIVTCALTGVLTDPKKFPVPVTVEQMASEARKAYDAGASMVHCHFRMQEEGMGHLPSWDHNIAKEVCDKIRERCPGILINMSTGVVGDDISAQLECLNSVKPEMASLNAGSLNYLKAQRSKPKWAWQPMVFDNSVEKINDFASAMYEINCVPECECFDTGIVRSCKLYQHVGILKPPAHISFIMGVQSGMPCKPDMLPILVDELPEGAHWQSICIGQKEIWDVHRKTAQLGGNLRTGLEDTFYLPDGSMAKDNGELIAALVQIAKEEGRQVATPAEAREMLGLNASKL